MTDLKDSLLANLALIFVAVAILTGFIYLQFMTPTLYEVDGYYHAAIAGFIKTFGPRYKFHWAQFSTFKDYFSDSYFLFHVSIIPFFIISKNIILSAKIAVIAYNALFLALYIYALKRYLPSLAAAFFLILPFLSSGFDFYFLLLRAVTLANCLAIMGIYLLIRKRPLALFIISVIYALSHLSFIMLVIFALICEVMRYALKKEFFSWNVYAVTSGVLLGCIIHPNYPNNFISIHLNDIIVPLHSIMRTDINLASEAVSSGARFIFVNNFAVFFAAGAILCGSLVTRVAVSLDTLVWLGCCAAYFAAAFFGDRFWYPVNVLFFIFAAAWSRDWAAKYRFREIAGKLRFIFVAGLVAVVLFVPSNIRTLRTSLKDYVAHNAYHEQAARWMESNIPSGELIYHASWSDSAYFICLNPKNDYFVLCDPVYMAYPYPERYLIYRKLEEGKMDRPYVALKYVFNVSYGYTENSNGLYPQIINDREHFKVIYDDKAGIVFKLIDPKR